jgi:hypothetical protein
MSDASRWNGNVTRLEASFAAALSEVSSGLPGTLFRYLLRPDGSDAVWYISPGCRVLFELSPAEMEADIGRAT